MNKILMVGGTWDLKGGKRSKLVDKFSKNLDNVTLFNGGNYNDLEKIIEMTSDYDTVIWWANVDNDLLKIRNVKDINYKTMLVTSKRNVDSKYTFQELIQRTLATKANLCVEFSKDKGNYIMRLFDPLGNVWYEGDNIDECSKCLNNRLNYIGSLTREKTNKIDTKEEISDLQRQRVNHCFLPIVRNYSNTFSNLIYGTDDVKRFLGNASFRCTKGFPSFRDKDSIYVSRRNIHKDELTIDQFVCTKLDDDTIYYVGDNKPSVDSPIQLRLYDLLPKINYMIHSHCYIKDAPYTEEVIPCGALEEVDEIKKLIDYYYDGDYEKDFYLINLIGHGSIMMSNDARRLANIEMIGREIPEKHKRILLNKK